jgi:plasmid maintenance system antidote protein VapI
MCEQTAMEKPRTSELATAAGISKSYASEILTGARTPTKPLAIHLFRATGWRHEVLADLTDEQLALLEQIERWSPRPAEKAA